MDSIVFGNKKIQKYKKPSYVDYLNRFGQDYADHWQSYYLWKRNFPKDPIGTFRPLTDPEKSYFDFAKQYYQHIPTRRTSEHSFFSPPAPWKKRLQLLTPPDQFITQMDALIQFSNKFCHDSERNNWNDVLAQLQKGTIEHLIWAVAFLKSTNGVADTVSCGHFAKVIAKVPNLTLQVYKDPYLIAAIIRQTSKWVKNTFVLVNIFRYIDEVWNGTPSDDFREWLMFFEIGPKTASLIFTSVFDQTVALPVDSHVWHAFRKWQWTTAKSPDECSWQASKWMPPSYFIKTNDAIGSIRQALADNKKKHTVLRKANQLPLEIKELVKLLQ
jgi:endonuclease III